MRKSELEKEIELTLSSIDNLSKVKAPSDFMESLTSKMIFRNEQIMWIRRAKYAVAAMIMLAIVNMVLLLSNKAPEREEMLRSVASEWNLTTQPR